MVGAEKARGVEEWIVWLLQSKYSKDRDVDLQYRSGPPADVVSSLRLFVVKELATTASYAMAANTGCIRTAAGSNDT